jgi:galactose mutarotase-like enzyme
MKYSICNDEVSFVSDSFNVEPWVLQFNGDGVNYFWRPADKEKLGTAVCFPLMGMLPNGKYTFDGKEYSLGMHGFAQDREFTVAEKSENKIIYELTDDEESYAQFPWHFNFRLIYTVEGSGLKTEYLIKNRDEKEMYYTVGGHPRYACPMGAGSRFEDYIIEFEKPESIKNIYKSYGPISEIEKCFSPDGKILHLDYCMFTQGCFCFHPVNSKVIVLKNRMNGRRLRINLGEAASLQFWTEPGGPFLCIEPIYGSTSHLPLLPEDGNWKNRPGTLRIKPGQTQTLAYYVEIAE